MVQRARVQGLCPACAWSFLTEPTEEQPEVPLAAHGDHGLFQLPNHRVLEEIARGGMGIVYRAQQLEPARVVALKMLLPHQAGSTEMLERFRLEVRTVAALEHPGILPIYQVGEYEGIPYFTMKLAAPGTLASRASPYRGRFREICELMAGIADAVHFAHERGVLHRDLKPGNILFDEAGRPYVSDFGLAKFTEFSEDQTPALTRSIQLLGTPQFLPPEIAAGGIGRATTAGDLYSLGAIFYELLTGRPPFAASGLTALLKAIVEEDPVRPAKLVASVPHDLEIICLKCLAKEPANRYGSARELAEDLRRWLAGRPILARPISMLARVRQWSRRNPALATVSWLLAAAIGIGAFLQIEANQHLRRAVREAGRALQESLLAQAALKRDSNTLGQRFDTLDLIARAVSVGLPSSGSPLQSALRTEMAGALALPDLKRVALRPIYVAHFEAEAGVSPDLSQYACALKEGGVGVYATVDNRLLRTFAGARQNPAVSFAFSPGGHWLGAGFQDGHLELYPMDGAHRSQSFPGSPTIRTTVEFLPDDSSAVINRGLAGIFVADLNARTNRLLVPPPAVGFALSVDPAGQRAAFQVGDNLRVIRIADGSNLWSAAAKDGVRCTAWSPNGRLLAVARGQPPYELSILDASTAQVLYSFHDHDIGVGCLSFHPDGRSIVSTSWDGRLVWRELAQDGFRLVSDGGPRLLRFSADGSRLAYEPSHGELGIYQVAQPSSLRSWRRKVPPDGESFMMCVSPDGRLVATSSTRGVHLWDVAAGEELSCLRLPADRWFVEVMFHPDGKSLLYSAVGTGIHQVALVEDTHGTATTGFHFGTDRQLGESEDLMALEFAADGRSLIVGANKQSFKNERRSPDIWLWPDADPSRARKLAGDWPLVGYHLSKDSRWGLTADTTEPDITVWDPATGRRLTQLGFNGPVFFEFIPDGKWLFASTREGYQLVELGSWKRGARWPAGFGQQHYRCWGFSPDSSLVAISEPNGRVDLRSLPQGARLAELPGSKAIQIRGLQFSRDGSRLLLMTATGAVQEWNLSELHHAWAGAGLDGRPAQR